jgi:hypothetical protein
MLNHSRRAIVPLLAASLSLLAHFAQNVWGLFHIADLTEAVRSLDYGGLLVALALIATIEGTVLFCFYLPGIPLIVLILLSLKPTWLEALSISACLLTGTMAGYGASMSLGRLMHERLPALVGEEQFRGIRLFIERFGLLTIVPSAFHPNNLALTFAVLGYFRARQVWQYFVVAILAQTGWWSLYAMVAGTFSGQTLITQSNFQLVLAALFFGWFLYEIVSSARAR